MTNSKQHHFTGIDVIKGYVDIALLNTKKELVENPFQLDDNKEGHKQLKTWLKGKTDAGYTVICGVENTGGYEQNWVNMLKGLREQNDSVEIYKLNPKAVKHQMQSLLKRTVTDPVSAEGIAMYLSNNYESLKSNWHHSTYKSQEDSDAQQFHKMIMGKLKTQTQMKNRLEKILYRAFPEMLVYCKNSIPGWLLRMLIKYPTVERVKKATHKGIAGVKGISAEKADAIKQKAKESTASQDSTMTELMIKQYSEDLLELGQNIKQLKNELIKQYDDPNTELLTSIKGIADWTATAVLLQLGDYKRFTDTSQLAAFYGVHPSFKQSGDGKYRAKMSKQGSPQMRAILYTAANGVILHEPYFQDLYAKYRSKGESHRVVVGIIMHKLLRVIYGMLKSQSKFDSNIDQANKDRTTQQPIEETKNINEKARRHQELNTDAPVSRSNYKKRRADLEHQSPISEKIRCHPVSALNANIKKVCQKFKKLTV